MELGKRLKRLRKVHRLKGKEVAQAIGVSDSTYRNYELGHREPSLDILVLIAKFYDVTADYLLGLDDTAPESSADTIAERYNLDIMEKKILEFYMTLPDRERRQFLSGIKSVQNNDESVYEKHLADALEYEESMHDIIELDK